MRERLSVILLGVLALAALVAAESFITMLIALQSPPQPFGSVHMWTICVTVKITPPCVSCTCARGVISAYVCDGSDNGEHAETGQLRLRAAAAAKEAEQRHRQIGGQRVLSILTTDDAAGNGEEREELYPG